LDTQIFACLLHDLKLKEFSNYQVLMVFFQQFELEEKHFQSQGWQLIESFNHF
jgi:hypothetical protein